MRILVTGGAGFIGSHIVDMLIANNHKVIVVDNLTTGNKKNLNKKAKFYKADLRSKKLESVFKKEKPQIIYHTAAQANVRISIEKPGYDADVNIIGGLNLLENCRKYKVKKIIHSSTGGAIYGEPEYLPCDETHPINPICHYGASKVAFEKYLFVYKLLYNLDYTILRYANVYGPRQDPKGEAGVVSIFIDLLQTNKKCLIFGDGKQTRDFVFVKDVACANVLAMKNTTSRIFNIGTQEKTSVNKIYKTIAKLMKKNIKAKHVNAIPGEVKHIYSEISLAKKELKWIPEYDLNSGLKETVKYFTS